MKLTRLLMLSSLTLLFAAFSTAGEQETPPSSGWQQTQKADATHSTAQFALAGKFLTPPQKDPGSPPLLLVNCKPLRSRRKFSAASVNVGTQLKVEYVEPDEIKAGMSYYPKVSVGYRLDDGKEEKAQWAPGTEKISASVPKPVLEKMLRSHTVQMKVADNHGGEIAMQFDIPDSTAVGTTCDLPISNK
jgi:hypothetical protein